MTNATRELLTETIEVPAEGDWLLSATCHRSGQLNDEAPVVLISSAAAMPKGFYDAFAQHLVRSGAHAAVTYDYRGIAGSAGDTSRWGELQMKDWALLDFPAMVRWCKETFPNRTLVGIGHSYGGQALGLCGCSSQFERYATVATQSGYWRSVDEPYSVWFKTQIVGKMTSKLLGRIPSWAGLGLAMPGSIFLEWARWVNTPDYFMSDPGLPEVSRFDEVTLPLLSMGLTDDRWGTKRAICEFMENYRNADLRMHWVTPPAERNVGHFRFFRPENKDICWPLATNFLLSETWPEPAKPIA